MKSDNSIDQVITSTSQTCRTCLSEVDVDVNIFNCYIELEGNLISKTLETCVLLQVDGTKRSIRM